MRGFDADADLSGAHLHERNDDVVTDSNAFADAARKNEHGHLPVAELCIPGHLPSNFDMHQPRKNRGPTGASIAVPAVCGKRFGSVDRSVCKALMCNYLHAK